MLIKYISQKLSITITVIYQNEIFFEDTYSKNIINTSLKPNLVASSLILNLKK